MFYEEQKQDRNFVIIMHLVRFVCLTPSKWKLKRKRERKRGVWNVGLFLFLITCRRLTGLKWDGING